MLVKVLKQQTTEYEANRCTESDKDKNYHVMEDWEIERYKAQLVLETKQNLKAKRVMHWITETPQVGVKTQKWNKT